MIVEVWQKKNRDFKCFECEENAEMKRKNSLFSSVVNSALSVSVQIHVFCYLEIPSLLEFIKFSLEFVAAVMNKHRLRVKYVRYIN